MKKISYKKSILFCSIFALFSLFAFAEPKYISPNNDGVQDELVIPLNINEKRYVQGWSLVIMDSQKNVVRTIGNKVALPQKLGFKSFFKQLVTPKKGVEIPKSIVWNRISNNKNPKCSSLSLQNFVLSLKVLCLMSLRALSNASPLRQPCV